METGYEVRRVGDGDGLVDLDRARGIAHDCGWNLEELAGFYVEGTLSQIRRIGAELEGERSAETVRRLAHGCAGSSLTSGVVGMAEIFRRIENARAGERLDVAEALLPEIRHRLEEAVRILTEADRGDGAPRGG